MDPIVWLGSESAYSLVKTYLDKFQFDKSAFMRSPFDRQDDAVDPTFKVASDRMGLSVMEKIGDKTVIKVHGSLTPSFSRWQAWFPGEVTSYEALKDAFAIAIEAGEKHVVMDFATPGGAVRGLDTVSDMMKKAKGAGIRIDAHTDSASMSAGYWLMSGADQITASKMAELGSIGTMAVVRTYADTAKNMGVEFTVLKAGEFKALGNPYEKLTEEARAYLQKNIEETNKFFLNHVSLNRNLLLSDTGRWAEGRTFFAQEAVQVGLVDKVASLDEVIGSGAAAKTQSDNRRFEMPISAEKLAQIAAGADPKDVLTEAELKMYNEALETEAKADPVTGEPEGEPAPAPDTKATTTDVPLTMAEDLRLAIRENGKLETKLETAVEANTKLEAKVQELQASLDSLQVVAQLAVGNLQVALGKPKESKESPAAILAQFNALQSEMADRFKTGRKSLGEQTEDTTKQSVGHVYRFNPSTIKNR